MLRQNLKKNLNLYKSLKKLKPDEFNHVIDHLDNNSIDSICECVYNILFVDWNLPKSKRKHLKHSIHKHCCIKRLKRISNKSIPIESRRKALRQEGKGLGFILSAAIPLLTNLLFKK